MKRRSRLFWRVFGSGLLLLLVTAGAFAVAGALIQREFREQRPFERLGLHLSQEVSSLLGDPAALRAYVERNRKLFEGELWVYREDGALLAGTRAPAPPPPGLSPLPLPGAPPPFAPTDWPLPPMAPLPLSPAAGLRGLEIHLIDRRSIWMPLHGRDGTHATMVLQFVEPLMPPPRGPALAMLCLVVGAVALLSWLLARAITAPVEQLTAAARALGAGDLHARARLARPDELGELGRAFDEMADTLSRLVLSEKELLANVSHELRTPLARLRVALELLEEQRLEPVQRYLGDMGCSLDELEQLVSDLLTSARLDLTTAMRGDVAPLLELRPIAGEVLLDLVAARFRMAWPDRHLAVELGDALPEVAVDVALIRRLLDNLLENAFKYSDPDRSITLRGSAMAGTLVVEVIDRGIGIEPGDLGRLFSPFFRTDRSRARGTGGSGLGLHIARRIAEAHHARLEADSTVGVGSTFRLTLQESSVSAAAP
jgi:signal transduction histidine kinase